MTDVQMEPTISSLQAQIEGLRKELEEARAEIARRDRVAQEAWGDQEDEHTPAINAAHPNRSGDHDTFWRALALVGKRRGKYPLVELVNWLLRRAETSEAALQAAQTEIERLKEALEPFARVADQADEDGLHDEVVLNVIYDGHGPEPGWSNTSLGEFFVRPFRKARAALTSQEQG